MSGPLPAIQLGADLRRYWWQWRPAGRCGPWTGLRISFVALFLRLLDTMLDAADAGVILGSCSWCFCENIENIWKQTKIQRFSNQPLHTFVHHFSSLPWLGQRWWHSQCRPLAGLPWPQFHLRSHADGNEDAQQENNRITRYQEVEWGRLWRTVVPRKDLDLLKDRQVSVKGALLSVLAIDNATGCMEAVGSGRNFISYEGELKHDHPTILFSKRN